MKYLFIGALIIVGIVAVTNREIDKGNAAAVEFKKKSIEAGKVAKKEASGIAEESSAIVIDLGKEVASGAYDVTKSAIQGAVKAMKD